MENKKIMNKKMSKIRLVHNCEKMSCVLLCKTDITLSFLAINAQKKTKLIKFCNAHENKTMLKKKTRFL